MDFNEYQNGTKQTRMESTYAHQLIYPALGLAGEAGELAGKVSKILRDQNGVLEVNDIALLKKEVGDCLWFLSELCADLGIALEDAAKANYDKLMDRLSRNVIGGSGDER